MGFDPSAMQSCKMQFLFHARRPFLYCRLCNTNTNKSQEHVFICPGLGTLANEDSVKYMDIFDQNLEKQVKAVKYWNLLLKTRTIKLNEMKLLCREAKCT